MIIIHIHIYIRKLKQDASEPSKQRRYLPELHYGEFPYLTCVSLSHIFISKCNGIFEIYIRLHVF